VLVDGAVVGVRHTGGGAGVGEDQVAPALFGQVAAGFGKGGDFGGPHQRVEHSAVEGSDREVARGGRFDALELVSDVGPAGACLQACQGCDLGCDPGGGFPVPVLRLTR
jgi:hypothetical protein